MKSKQTINVALIGNPNTGKTSVFNQLTGLNQQVGNYPGITVEKKIGFCKLSNNVKIFTKFKKSQSQLKLTYMGNCKPKFVAFRRKLDFSECREKHLFP